MNMVTISEAANELGCRPRDISDALYNRWFDPGRCFQLGNRRLIPRDALPDLREALASHGRNRSSLETARA